MASLEQWKEWKEDYLLDYMAAVERCAFQFALYNLNEEGVVFNADKAANLISEAYDKDFLDDNSPSYIFILASLCWYSGMNQRRLRPYKIEDAIRDYNRAVDEHDDLISALNGFNGYCNGAFWFVYIPLIDFIGFYVRNHPLVYREKLLKWLNGSIDLSYCGLTRKQLFEFLCSMTRYGLYKLLVDNHFSHPNDLFDLVQKEDSDGFFRICDENKVDLTNLSEIAGFILNGQSIHVIEDDPETYKTKSRNLSEMVGTKEADLNEILSQIYNHEFVCEVLPFEITEDESLNITTLAYSTAINIPYLELIEDDDDVIIMDRFISNPYFEGFMKIVEYIRLTLKAPVIKQFNQYLSQDEIDKFLPNLEVESYKDESSGQTLSLCKTLASRWMTEQYGRMNDDTLINICANQIWPQLIEQVDNLQWTPAKRGLASFPKIKNMLAACILFHALELAQIAKLPKQEEYAISDEDYMSAEDRAQAGISATSNRNAGIVHTKKKYNDTLPVGYMEVLEKFIKEEDLPGRTTSRTYLKLVNKWVKMKLESIRDNIDSEASAKLFVAECKNDLGPQFYLFQDNKVKIKAILKHWKDLLPEIFNVPI